MSEKCKSSPPTRLLPKGGKGGERRGGEGKGDEGRGVEGGEGDTDPGESNKKHRQEMLLLTRLDPGQARRERRGGEQHGPAARVKW